MGVEVTSSRGLSHCTSKGSCGFSGRVLSQAPLQAPAGWGALSLDSASAVPLIAPPLPSHSGCPNLGPIIFPQDSFPAQAAGRLFLKEHSDSCSTSWLKSSQRRCHWLRNKAQPVISKALSLGAGQNTSFILPSPSHGVPSSSVPPFQPSHMHGLG